MGGGGSSSQPRDNTVNNQPWSGQQPYLRDLYSAAGQIASTPQQYYPGSTVAPQDQATTDAQAMAEARARAGNPLVPQAQDYTSSVLKGDYLNSNPWLDKTYDQAASSVTRNFNLATLPALETRFAMAGRHGGAYENALGGATRELGSSLTNLATDIYGGNYARERGTQETAAGRAPTLAEADYTDAANLGAVGAARDTFSQQQLDDLINRFNFGQQEPSQRAEEFASLIGSPVTGTSKTTYRGGTTGWGSSVYQALGK